MKYLAYHFTVTPPQPGSDILIAFIEDKGFESFDYTDAGFTAYLPEGTHSHIDFSDIEVEDFKFSYEVETIAETNWNAEWEKNFEPVVVDDLLCIRAPFHEKNTVTNYEIVIMPKMSFGTGHHQTTRLMCKSMSTLDLKEKRVLDMGTGTGILAIFAKQLGAKEVLGIDIDEWSVENAIENCASNKFAEIHLKKGDIDLLAKELEFDVILANINKNILKSHLPVYSTKLVSGGKLLLSGFFSTDTAELQELAESLSLKLLSTSTENEWAMMVLEKR
jgi:ribosomal protein L11 methyltransferase